MIALLATAHAASVVCDGAEARRVLVEARIDEARVPVTHPWLVPGLAREALDPEAAAAVARVCEEGDERFVDRAESYQGPGWSAHTLVLVGVSRQGCSVVHHRVALTVGIGPDGTRYSLRASLPDERTPDQTCDAAAVWQEERVLAGADAEVRLVRQVDHQGDRVVGSRLLVRRADPGGWSEQTLIEPAPPRVWELPDRGQGAAGPEVALASTRSGEPLVVASHDRTAAPCRPIGGQTVWRLERDRWVAIDGRDAATLLARAGLWRLAGDDGWMLIVAQDDDDEVALLDPRLRRLQRRSSDPLFLMSSSDFPELNGGFRVIAPGPWATEAEARAARRDWGRGGYVKLAWRAADPCGAP